MLWRFEVNADNVQFIVYTATGPRSVIGPKHNLQLKHYTLQYNRLDSQPTIFIEGVEVGRVKG